MGEELVKLEPNPIKYKKVFFNNLQDYLAIGMTSDEYWNGDSQLVKSYRNAWKIKSKHENYSAWLNGLYVSEAINSSISSIFSKQPQSYMLQPIAITTEEREEREKNKYEKFKAQLKAEARVNKKQEAK